MKRVFVLAAIVTVLVVAVAHDLARAQQPSPPPAAYAPGIGDLMNTLIQPRHTKLGLAGRAGNWPLAAYALAEIRQSFASLEKAVPKYRGMPVAELADAALRQPLDAVEAAIRAQDAQQFAAAYDRLTQGCNACHQSVDHPFVVIRVPDASAFPDQNFSPRR